MMKTLPVHKWVTISLLVFTFAGIKSIMFTSELLFLLHFIARMCLCHVAHEFAYVAVILKYSSVVIHIHMQCSTGWKRQPPTF